MFPTIHPGWPEWLILAIVVVAFGFPALSAYAVAKINQQTKAINDNAKKTEAVRQEVVGGQQDNPLRDDIDSLKRGMVGVRIAVDDLAAVQEAHAKSIEKRFRISQESLASAVDDHKRDIDSEHRWTRKQLDKQAGLIKSMMEHFRVEHPDNDPKKHERG